MPDWNHPLIQTQLKVWQMMDSWRDRATEAQLDLIKTAQDYVSYGGKGMPGHHFAHLVDFLVKELDTYKTSYLVTTDWSMKQDTAAFEIAKRLKELSADDATDKE